MLGCFDGMPVNWSVGRSQSAELANSSLRGTITRRRPGARTVVHLDCGCHYRWSDWDGIRDEGGSSGA